LWEAAEAIPVGFVQRLASLREAGAFNQLFQAAFFNPSFEVEAPTRRMFYSVTARGLGLGGSWRAQLTSCR
jgi:hypothetical protein